VNRFFNFLTDERELRLGVLEKIFQRLGLAVGIHRNTYRPAVENSEIRDRPARMILSDQRDAIAKRNTFAFEAVRDRSDVPKRVAKVIDLRVVTDDPHRDAIRSRFERINKSF
jgi:hypothetical protein